MSLSEAEIGLIVEEIAPMCGRASLQRVLEPGPRQLVLRFRQPGETRWLAVSTEHDATRLHFLDDKPDQPGHPSPFAMLARKWLHGAALEEVDQVRGDRVVRLLLRTLDPREEHPSVEDRHPDRIDVSLICELAGRVGNIFLLDSDDQIVGMQTDEAIGGREFEVGERWSPPPPPPDSAVGREVRWELASLPHDDLSRSRRVTRAYAQKLQAQRREELYERIESDLETQLERFERRIEHVERDLENVEDAGEYRRRAELLQSAYGEAERGDDSVRVPDFYRDGMPEVEIPLDPAKSLQENIDDYYHEAQRYENARERVEQRLLDSIDLRDRAERELHDLRELDDPTIEKLGDLRERLRDEQILPRSRQPRQAGPANEQTSTRPYRTFRALSGRRILVGKGASENDTLSTKVARGRDFWFHARDWPGAHVVLRLENRDESPASDDLVDAATLAAHFSKGSRDTSVEVSYTRAKHVRKHGDLPPGRVMIANEKTIAVRLEDDRLERLLESEQE